MGVQLVPGYVIRIGESFSTLVAHVLLSVRMRLEVLEHDAPLVKALVALRTNVALLTSVKGGVMTFEGVRVYRLVITLITHQI